jgi:hypothetical protein
VRLNAVVGFATLLALLPASTQAAVRVCKEKITSGPHVAKTIAEGQKLALDAWTKAAGVSGVRFSAWRLAITKSLSCQPFTEHNVVCVASASPCAIEQVPSPTPAPSQPPVAGPRVIPLQPALPSAKPLNI